MSYTYVKFNNKDTASSIREKINNMGTEVSNMSTEVDNINVEVGDIQSQIDSLKNNIDTLKKDYVIDSGITDDGNWYYRKWDNGDYECWLRYIINTTIEDTSGSNFMSSKLALFEYPIKFTSIPECQISIQGTNGYGAWLYSSNYSTATTPPQFYLMRSTKMTTARDFAINIDVKGKWK